MITIVYGKQPLFTVRTEGDALYDEASLRLHTYGDGFGYVTELNDSSEIFQSLMGDHYVKLDFYTEDYVDVPVGASISYGGLTWTTTFKQLPSPVGAGWHYTLQFDAPEMQMRRYLMAYTGQGRREMSFAITTDLKTAAQVVCDCMNGTDNPNDYTWAVGLCSKGDGAGEISTMSFNGETCFDACSLIADVFKTEWYATYDGTTVTLNFAKCEVGTSVDFKVGDNELLDSMTPQGGNDKEFGTRFWCFGSTRNLDYSYIQAHLTAKDHTALSTISEPRLLPRNASGSIVNPIYAKNGQVVPAKDVSKDEYIDRMVFFEDEYPKTDTVITGVRTREVTFSDSDEKYIAYMVECSNADFFKGEKSILKGQTLALRFNDSKSDLYGWEFDLAYKGAQHMLTVDGIGSSEEPNVGEDSVVLVEGNAEGSGSIELDTAYFDSDYIGTYLLNNGSNGIGRCWLNIPETVKVADFAPFLYLYTYNKSTNRWDYETSTALSKSRIATAEGAEFNTGYNLAIPSGSSFPLFARDKECKVVIAATFRLYRKFKDVTPTEEELAATIYVPYKLESFGEDLLVTSKPTETVKEFEIVPQVMGKGSDGKTVVVPNPYQKPNVGNVFTLLNVEIPDSYILSAEKHLYDTACEYAKKHSSDTNVYSCEANVVVVGEDETQYGLGQLVRLVDSNLFKHMGGYRASRIQEYTKNFIYPFKATYIVGDNTAYSYTGDIKSEGEDATYSQRIGISGSEEGSRIIGTGDNNTPTNENLYSALKIEKLLSLYMLKSEARKYIGGGVNFGGNGDLPIYIDDEGNVCCDANFYTTGWSTAQKKQGDGMGTEPNKTSLTEETMWLALANNTKAHKIDSSLLKWSNDGSIYVDELGFIHARGGSQGGTEGGEQGTPSDLTAYLKKDEATTLYLSKVNADTAKGVITFEQGIRVGTGETAVTITNDGGDLKIDGNTLVTGWLAALRKGASSSESSFTEEQMWLALTNAGTHRIDGRNIKIDGNTIRTASDGTLYAVGGGSGGDEPANLSEYIKRIDADERYIRKDMADETAFPVTFKDGIVLAKGDKTVKIELDTDGDVKIDGNAFTTGWLAGLAKGQDGSDSVFTEEQMWLALGATARDRRISGRVIKIDGDTLKTTANGTLYADVPVYSGGGGESGGGEPADLSNYYTKDWINANIYTAQEVDEGFYDKDWIDGNIYTAQEVDDKFCTKDYISENVYTVEEAKGVFYQIEYDNGDAVEVATQKWVNNNFYTWREIDDMGFLKSDDLYGYATQEWVRNTALDGYATKQYVDEALWGFLKKDADDSTTGVVNFTNGIQIDGISITAVNGILTIDSSVFAYGDFTGTNY